MKELYEKVFIKSESDLPKVDGNYICHHTGRKENELDLFPFKVKESHWFVKIDWYLQPVTAKTEQETTKDDLKQYMTNLLYYAHVEAMDMHSIDFDKWVEREVDNIAGYLNKEKVTDECCHPYAFVYRKGDYERCDKCGKILCEG